MSQKSQQALAVQVDSWREGGGWEQVAWVEGEGIKLLICENTVIDFNWFSQ